MWETTQCVEKSQETILPENTIYLLLDMKKRTCPEMGSAPNHSFGSNELMIMFITW